MEGHGNRENNCFVVASAPGKFPKPEYYQGLGVYGDSCKNHVQTWFHILSKLKTSFKIFSSIIKHLQSSISHRAPGTRCWEFRCTLSCFQMMKLPYLLYDPITPMKFKNFKCILSNICHCNINTLMRLWVRRGLEIFHFPLESVD